MMARTKLDDRLVRALREGSSALPEDPPLLRGYLRTIAALMEEKAAEIEPSWAQACAAAAEIETLQTLEAAVAERAISARARDLLDVRAKIEIWRALGEGAAEADPASPRERLIHSVDADLARIARDGR